VGKKRKFIGEGYEFSQGGPEKTGIVTILVRKNFDIPRVDQGISNHKNTAVAVGGFPRPGSGKTHKAQSAQIIALIKPFVGFQIFPCRRRRMDFYVEFFTKGDAVALVVGARQRDRADRRGVEQALPHGIGARNGNKDDPSPGLENRTASAIAPDLFLVALPELQARRDGLGFLNRVHTSKNDFSLLRNPAL